MRQIFIGFIFIFLDFNLTFDHSQIGLIPDFIGYIVMINGLVEMAEESPLFMKVKPYATGMVVYTGILYLLDLVGASMSWGALSYILVITATIVSLYISYHIVMGVRDMETKYSVLLNGESLEFTWKLLAVFEVLTFVSLMIPTVAIVCIVVSFIVAICFLIAFSNSKNLYYDTVNK